MTMRYLCVAALTICQLLVLSRANMTTESCRNEVENLSHLLQQVRDENKVFRDNCCSVIYRFFLTDTPSFWDDAAVQCKRKGGDLVDWNTFGFGAPGNAYFSVMSDLVQEARQVWVGATDTVSEGYYFWTDGQMYQPFENVLQFAKWGSGQPSNDDVYDSEGEDCMLVSYGGGAGNEYLIDSYCAHSSFTYKGLCQKKLEVC